MSFAKLMNFMKFPNSFTKLSAKSCFALDYKALSGISILTWSHVRPCFEELIED